MTRTALVKKTPSIENPTLNLFDHLTPMSRRDLRNIALAAGFMQLPPQILK